MGRVAAIGAEPLVRGFGLVGVLVLPAEDDDAARTAWQRLPGDVELVILSPAAAAAIGPPVAVHPGPIVAVIPE